MHGTMNIKIKLHTSQWRQKIIFLVTKYLFVFFFQSLTALVDLGLLYEVPLSHPGTPHMVGPLRTSDQPDVGTSTRRHPTLTTGIHVPGGIRTSNTSKRGAADPYFRPHSHSGFVKDSLHQKCWEAENFGPYHIDKTELNSTYIYNIPQRPVWP